MVARNRDVEADLLVRGRRGRLLESRSKKLARQCGLEWEPLNRFRRDNEGEINIVMVSGFDDKPSASAKSARDSLKAKAKAAGINWDGLLAFIQGLMPIIASFMGMCG